MDGSQKEGKRQCAPTVCRFFSTDLHRMDGYECDILYDPEDLEKRMHTGTGIEIRWIISGEMHSFLNEDS